jgi:hypothetical protein
MATDIKGNVRPPMAMPEHVRTLREQSKPPRESQMPLPIKFFIGYCFLRAAVALTFALVVGIAPESDTAIYLSERFDPYSHELPPEALFYIVAILYSVIGWRWLRRDGRARWVAMFMSGATAARAAVWLIADQIAGNPIQVSPELRGVVVLMIVVNLLICAFLAFYPGMEQSFRETP